MNIRVLIVDDQTYIVRILEKFFSADPFFKVDTTTSSITAIELALKNSYDALICDVIMPVFNGFEMVRQLKAVYSCPFTVVYITGVASVNLKTVADNTVLVRKPFNSNEIMSFISRCYAQREQRARSLRPHKDSPPLLPLHQAAREGDIAKIKALAEEGTAVQIRDGWGRTPLSWAAWAGRAAVTEWLLEQGAIVNTQDNRGMTPLHFAAWEGGVEAVDCLIRHKADVNRRDHDRWTPLHWAVEYGNKKTAGVLGKQGGKET